jgi:hypothetical protein
MKTMMQLTRWVCLAIFMVVAPQAWAAKNPTTFATAEEGVAALVSATSAKDREALRVLFGLATEKLVAIDPVQFANQLEAFTAAYNARHQIRSLSDTEKVLDVGENNWPFPIPLVKEDGRWYFDTDAGLDELLARWIGQNELATLKVVRAYVMAQREYASSDRDGDSVLEYAQRFTSSNGKKDGLYWSQLLDGEISPLGPMAAEAAREGYRRSGDDPVPFHGYYFKILTRQGRHAPGGRYRYTINENMIGGFALVAWPSEYGQSGIMTFIVNHQGRVYQKDLGSRTDRIVNSMQEYNPDSSWSVSPD